MRSFVLTLSSWHIRLCVQITSRRPMLPSDRKKIEEKTADVHGNGKALIGLPVVLCSCAVRHISLDVIFFKKLKL